MTRPETTELVDQLVRCCVDSRFILHAYGAMCRRHADGLPAGFNESLDQVTEAIEAGQTFVAKLVEA